MKIHFFICIVLICFNASNAFSLANIFNQAVTFLTQLFQQIKLPALPSPSTIQPVSKTTNMPKASCPQINSISNLSISNVFFFQQFYIKKHK